jgi:hypothetical protein
MYAKWPYKLNRLDFVHCISRAEGECHWNSASRRQEMLVSEHASLVCGEEDLSLDCKSGEDVSFSDFN